MNETIEDRLRRVLSDAAFHEVPDTAPIPPRRTGDESGVARSRRLRPWLVPSLVGVAAAVIAVVATAVVVHRTGPQTATGPVAAVTTVASTVDHTMPSLSTVPNLAGLTQLEATNVLATLNLKIQIKSVVSADSQKGQVLSQSPKAGASVKPGTIVTATVGAGPTYAQVPTDLVGLSVKDATAELKALRLSVLVQPVDSVEPLNQVLTVGMAGQRALAGTTVVLQASNNRLFVVPNLSNLTLDQATHALQQAGWTGTAVVERSAPTMDSSAVGLVPESSVTAVDPATNQSVGTLAPQNPKFKSTAEKNAVVTVVVYVKAKFQVPTFTTGVSTLDSLDFAGLADVVSVKQTWVSPAVPGTIVSISGASPGSVVDFDTPLTVTVWGQKPAK